MYNYPSFVLGHQLFIIIITQLSFSLSLASAIIHVLSSTH